MKRKKYHHGRFSLKPATVDKMVTTIHQLIKCDVKRSGYSALSSGARSFVLSDINTIVKKYIYHDKGPNPETLRELSFKKFLAVNDHMKGFGAKDWFPSPTLCHSRLSDIEKTLIRARSLCRFIMVPLEEDEFLRNCKNSGGVSIGVPFTDTSNDRKFTFPLSTTRDALPLFRYYMSQDEKLLRAVKSFNSTHPLGSMYKEVGTSRATTVPKTNEIDRMIAIEPTVNMYLQQGLMSSMYTRLRCVGLDVATLPERHKRLAQESSITHENATIDFSSASDCLSIELLRYLLPPAWFSLLSAVRSPSMTLNGQEVKLNMFSTMGNATTFPLETLVFYCLGVASHFTHHQPLSSSTLVTPKSRSMISVFGDDCIIPESCVDLFKKVCTSVGFLVNSEKSFWGESDFRESCGGDYLSGENVRLLYLKAPVTQSITGLESWLYSTLNKVLEFYRRIFGSLNYVYDRAALRYLFSLFRRHNLLVRVVPEDYPSDAGAYMSKDIRRFALCYKIKFFPIRETKQGGFTFTYLRFRYKNQKRQCDRIRYSIELKRLYESTERNIRGHLVPVVRLEPTLFSPIRRIGGYIVARGYSVHWTVDYPT